MQSGSKWDNKMFEDLSKLASSSMGTVMNLGKDLEAAVKQNVARLIDAMELVTRDELHAKMARIKTLEEENKALAVRVARLEEALGLAEKKAKKTRQPRTAARAGKKA